MIFNHKKYYFNPVTLTFEEIRINQIRRFLGLVGYLFVVFAFIFASGYALNHLLGSRESKVLKGQVGVLTSEMGKLQEKGHEFSGTIKNTIFRKDNTYRIILQMDTLPLSLRYAGTGGSAAENEMARQTEISYQVNDLIQSLTSQLQIQSASFSQLYKKAMEYSEGTVRLPAIQPVAHKDLSMISSDFGIRSDPFFFTERNHNGLDFVAPRGTNVYATGDGIVTFVRYSRTGYGNEIVIDHSFGFSSRYAHLDSIQVQDEEQIKRGQVIGTVGKTGRATGPHLHYEVLYKKSPVNPSYYFDTTLTREEFAQIINKANKEEILKY